ncbi:hypothetical protein IAQ61_007055 [Plenodomus lingam]|uniref:uncharacterized protein n=1 Tax=Leptosphaeria maculans TaxID=5022 RepID=UPI003318D344|nr:hypothetical protein IAQ61_007055 [Plenodomus lingam]
MDRRWEHVRARFDKISSREGYRWLADAAVGYRWVLRATAATRIFELYVSIYAIILVICAAASGSVNLADLGLVEVPSEMFWLK